MTGVHTRFMFKDNMDMALSKRFGEHVFQFLQRLQRNVCHSGVRFRVGDGLFQTGINLGGG